VTVAGDFLVRLATARDRLRAHASAAPPHALTSPDPPSGERWDWGQVWAHLGEFCPYWTGQIRAILGRPASEDPVPFGRTKADPERIAAIERDRHEPAASLLDRLETQLEGVRALLAGLRGEDWKRRGRHPTLGDLAMPKIVDEFLVGHLEAHADQLDELTGGRTGR